MSMQNGAICSDTALGEIIDKAAGLPLDYQAWLLRLAKGMAFSKSCRTKQEYRTQDNNATAGQSGGAALNKQ